MPKAMGMAAFSTTICVSALKLCHPVSTYVQILLMEKYFGETSSCACCYVLC